MLVHLEKALVGLKYIQGSANLFTHLTTAIEIRDTRQKRSRESLKERHNLLFILYTSFLRAFVEDSPPILHVHLVPRPLV